MTEISKSVNGNKFKQEVLGLLKKLKNSGIVENVETGKKIAIDNDHRPQFYAPFSVTGDGFEVVIFTMTTMRSDRNKINQWDAMGIKSFRGNGIKCVVLLPDFLVEKEEYFLSKEKEKNGQEGFLTYIDGILRLNELENYLKDLAK